MNHRGPTHALQLFPFLAVLVCVMGSLIFLLLLTTARIRQQAIARDRAERAGAVAVAKAEALDAQPADPELVAALIDLADDTPTATNADVMPSVEPSPPAPDLETLRQARRLEFLSQLAARTDARDRLATTLQQQQLFVAAAERRTHALRDQLQQAERQLGAAAGEVAAARLSTPKVDHERAQLEQQILSLRRRLKQAEVQQRAMEGKFAIVPFDGKSGTTRRPVFIECTDTGFRFLPEDVVIRPADVEGFTERYNPLLAGAMALSSYWDRRSDPGDSSEDPYVLLLVRPSGTIAFYISQRLLSKINQPFGYELIPDDLPLHLSEADPGAKAACEAAVARVLAERGPLTNSIAESSGDASGGGFGGGGLGESQPMRSPSGAVHPQATASTPRGGFELADLDKPAGVGDRSWENVERFEGQEHRRAGDPGTPPADSSIEAVRPPRPLAEPRRPVPSGGAPGTSDGAPVTTAEFSEPNAPSFAERRGSRPGDRSLPYEQLQRRRWGQFGPNATIGIEHEVLIRVEAQRLIIDDRWAVTVPNGISRTELFDRLLSVVDRQANGWGPAPNGFFWVPRLKFAISPGGNAVYDRIAPLITKSGLDSTTEFAKDR